MFAFENKVGNILTTICVSAEADGISESLNISTEKEDYIIGITLSFRENSMMVTKSTRYIVEANYSSGKTETVTSAATVSSTAPLTFSGSQITANKVNGILGELPVTASYQGFTDTKTLTVSSDIVDNQFVLSVTEYIYDDGYSYQYSHTEKPGANCCPDDEDPTISLWGYAMLADGSKMDYNSSYLNYSCTSIPCDCGHDDHGITPDTYHDIYILKYLGMEIARWTFRY